MTRTDEESEDDESEEDEEAESEEDDEEDEDGIKEKPLSKRPAGAAKRPAAAAALSPESSKKSKGSEKARPLGCPRCHHSQNGCSTCKNPNYKPRV